MRGRKREKLSIGKEHFSGVAVGRLFKNRSFCSLAVIGGVAASASEASQPKRREKVESHFCVEEKGGENPRQKVKQINGSQYVTRQTPSAFSLRCKRRGESVLIDKEDFRKEKWIAIGLVVLPK